MRRVGVHLRIASLGVAVALAGPGDGASATDLSADPPSSQRPSAGTVGAQGVPTRGMGKNGAVGLDKLLKLPKSYEFDDERRAGATRSEWRSRFEVAREDLAKAEQNLERIRDELESLAGGAASWQMAPPGVDLSSAENPVSYRLTQELRRGREEVERAEHRLTELDVEANLAGVPEDWRL